MKKGIHPQYHKDAKYTDSSSGAVFTFGSTVENLTVEISSLTHPFYTGKQKIVDTDDLVKKFEERRARADASSIQKKKKKLVDRRKSSVNKVDEQKKVTLKDMLKQFK